MEKQSNICKQKSFVKNKQSEVALVTLGFCSYFICKRSIEKHKKYVYF